MDRDIQALIARLLAHRAAAEGGSPRAADAHRRGLPPGAGRPRRSSCGSFAARSTPRVSSIAYCRSSWRKWDTLQKLAGHANNQPAHEHLESLLRGGWLEAGESREQGRWQPLWISFLHLGRMQAALGLPRRDDLARRFEKETTRPFYDPRLTAIAAPLASQPPQRALDRLALLRALDGWIGTCRRPHRDIIRRRRRPPQPPTTRRLSRGKTGTKPALST